MGRSKSGRRKSPRRQRAKKVTISVAKIVSKNGIVIREVDDPYATKAGQRILARINPREDIFEFMRGYKMLTDARYAVAVRFRALHERAEIGAVGAIDYAKPKIDGAVAGDVFTDKLLQAKRDLEHVALAVGRDKLGFLTSLLHVRTGFDDMARHYAAAYHLDDRGARGFLRGLVCQALDALAEHWGIDRAVGSSRPRPVKGVRGAPLVKGSIDYDKEVEVVDFQPEEVCA
jgi:hypothetical protein